MLKAVDIKLQLSQCFSSYHSRQSRIVEGGLYTNDITVCVNLN